VSCKDLKGAEGIARFGFNDPGGWPRAAFVYPSVIVRSSLHHPCTMWPDLIQMTKQRVKGKESSHQAASGISADSANQPKFRSGREEMTFGGWAWGFSGQGKGLFQLPAQLG